MSAPTDVAQEYYVEDVIYHMDKNRQPRIGMVTESYEVDSYDNSEKPLCKGQLRVLWMNKMQDQIVKENEVQLVSRMIHPGAIVRRFEKDKDTQRGYCRGVNVSTTVQLFGSKRIVENVPPKRVLTLNAMERLPVCIGTLFGRLVDVDNKMTLSSICGSIVEFNLDGNQGLFNQLHIRSDIDPFKLHLIYQSIERVTLVPKRILNAKWIKKSRPITRNMHKRQIFFVQRVQVTNLVINVKSFKDGESSYYYHVPDEDLPKLKILPTKFDMIPEIFEFALLHPLATDKTMHKHTWLSKFNPDHTKPLVSAPYIRPFADNLCGLETPYSVLSTLPSSLSSDNINESSDEEWLTDEEDTDSSSYSLASNLLEHHVIAETLCNHIKAIVVWQDGTIEEDIPSTELGPSLYMNEHEFFPGNFVVRADNDLEKYGVVQCVNHLERTALINWFTYTEPEPAPILRSTTEMSVYDIKVHPSFTFTPGRIVHKRIECENNMGTIVDSHPEGYVLISWLDGKDEQCWPHTIAHIDPMVGEFDDKSDIDISDPTSSIISWETESVDSLVGDPNSEITCLNLSSRLEFIMRQIRLLGRVMKNGCFLSQENVYFIISLLAIHENAKYMDRLLGTSYFNVTNAEYQSILDKIKGKVKDYGVAVSSKLLSCTPLEAKDIEIFALNESMQKNLFQGEIKDWADKIYHNHVDNIDMVKDATSATLLFCEFLEVLMVRLNSAYDKLISYLESPDDCKLPKPIVTTAAHSISTKSNDSLMSVASTSTKLSTSKESKFDSKPPTDDVKHNDMDDDVVAKYFDVLDEVHPSHRFINNYMWREQSANFHRIVAKEIKLLKEALPPGVWVYSYSNRLDLQSVMIRGPNNTPYENGLFIFDMHLSANYPNSPPSCHYISYNSERLNPNLYVEGRVCVSLLGTWEGHGTEVWGPNSTLLQLIVSLQGLILVAEPYFNEAGYDKQCNSQRGLENSRGYNELVLLRLVQSMTELIENPYAVFKEEILKHFKEYGLQLLNRLNGWIDETCERAPDFSLFPISRGLKLSLKTALDKFQAILQKHKLVKK